MGAFNTVTIYHECANCGHKIPLNVQFKYGDVWQHHYQIGDILQWGKNNIGKPGHKRVVAEAYSEDCSFCGNPGQDYEVWLENDQIIGVKPAEGKFDFVHSEDPYIVLGE